MTTQRSAQGKGGEGKINRYQRNDKAGVCGGLNAQVEVFSAEEPPRPPGRDDGRAKARLPIQKGQAASHKKKSLGRMKIDAKEEKVETVPADEPFLVGSNLPDESRRLKQGRHPRKKDNQVSSSNLPVRRSVFTVTWMRRLQNKNARAPVGPGIDRPGAYAVPGPGLESSSDDPRTAARRDVEGQEEEPKIERAECPRWLWVVGALVGVGVIVTAILAGTGHFAPKAAVPTAVRTTAAPTATPAAPTPAWCPSSKVVPDDVSAFDEFGKSVAMDGDTAVVGAPKDDYNDSNSGSVYVFTRIGSMWELQAKLTPSDGATDDKFGYSVDIHGDTIVAGAPHYNDNGLLSGSAYVFVRTGTTWAEQTKVTPNDGYYDDRFGDSVAIDGDTIVVGAPWDDDNGSSSGSAYVFVRTGTTWAEQTKLTPTDGASGDRFGESVAIDGDTIVAGAPHDNDDGLWSGSAYVFVRTGTTWIEQAKITPNNGVGGDTFGWSVAINGDTIVVGAPFDDDNFWIASGSAYSGSAYVFVRTGTTWAEQTKLTPTDGASGDRFGESVAIDGDTIVVGAYWDDDNGSNSGSAYVFVRNGSTLTQTKKLLAPDGAAKDHFGYNVRLSGNTAIVGALGDDTDNGIDSGSAHVIELC